jgi:hypothetical protein
MIEEPSLFDYLNDISTEKKYLFDSEVNKNYNTFMINRGLAQHIDTIMYANEVNKRPSMSKRMAHDFLFYSIEPKKRYGKWVKSEIEDEDLLKLLKEMYSINDEVACMYLRLSDKEELKSLVKKFNSKGGKV